MRESLKEKIIIGFIAFIASIAGSAIGACMAYKSVQVQRIEASVDIREKMLSISNQIIELSQEYYKVLLEGGDQNKIDILISKLKLLEENFKAYAQKVSELEGKKSEELNLDFFPPLPVRDLRQSNNE